MHEAKPVFNLNHKIEFTIFRNPNCGKLTSTACVIFLFLDVNSSSAYVSRDAVTGMKVGPEIAGLELCYLARTTANYCGKGS